jgi:FAD synthetase
MKEKKVMCFGTFDLLHLGHINLLKQAKKHGNYLIVIIARDVNIVGKHKIVHTEDDRLELIKNINLVDKAVLGDKKDKLKPILKIKPNVICLGYDQEIDEIKLKEILAKQNFFPKIIRLKPFREKKHKSSLIKKKFEN